MTGELEEVSVLTLLSCKRVVLTLVLVMAATGCGKIYGSSGSQKLTPAGSAANSASVTVTDTQLVDATTGWVISNEGLSLTSDGGKTWQDITPVGLKPDEVNAAYFLDGSTGWVGAVTPSSGATSDLRIDRTVDGGRTWSSAIVDNGVVYSDAAQSQGHIDFLDGKVGYFAFALASSSASRSGVLFKSSDSGASWTQESLPVFGQIAFATPTDGWVAEENGSRLWVSKDSGQKWQLSSLGSLLPAQGGSFVSIPSFVGQAPGDVTVTEIGDKAVSLSVFDTQDQGNTWNLLATTPLGNINDLVPDPSSLTSAGTLVVSSQSGDLIDNISSDGSTSSVTPSGLPSLSGLIELSFPTPSEGWAVVIGGSCVNKSSCSEFSELFQTADGGGIWSQLVPSTAGPPPPTAAP